MGKMVVRFVDDTGAQYGPITCSSTDPKPILPGSQAGRPLVETDTGTLFIWDGAAWQPQNKQQLVTVQPATDFSGIAQPMLIDVRGKTLVDTTGKILDSRAGIVGNLTQSLAINEGLNTIASTGGLVFMKDGVGGTPASPLTLMTPIVLPNPNTYYTYDSVRWPFYVIGLIGQGEGKTNLILDPSVTVGNATIDGGLSGWIATQRNILRLEAFSFGGNGTIPPARIRYWHPRIRSVFVENSGHTVSPWLSGGGGGPGFPCWIDGLYMRLQNGNGIPQFWHENLVGHMEIELISASGSYGNSLSQFLGTSVILNSMEYWSSGSTLGTGNALIYNHGCANLTIEKLVFPAPGGTPADIQVFKNDVAASYTKVYDLAPIASLSKITGAGKNYACFNSTDTATPQLVLIDADELWTVFGQTTYALGASPVTMTPLDYPTVFVTNSQAQTLTLPLAATVRPTTIITIFKTDANTNILSLARQGTDLINGVSTSLTLAAQFKSYSLRPDGVSNWYIVGST